MIVLAAPFSQSAVKPQLVDPGYVLKSAGNAASLRVDRPGMHYAAEFTLPAMTPESGRLLVGRLARARSEGIRVAWPLVGAVQGSPGSPQVDGTDSAGTTLKLKGLTPGYLAKEGYWLNVIDGAGVHYLHQVAEATVRAGSDGKATLAVWPPLRCALADSATVKLTGVQIEGVLTSDVAWEIPVNRLFVPPAIAIEEAN
ncbi:hypothetical protein [Novosphingobium olei]|uniref:hypothetical protein n=1 Tax=Novosphingobium olei TaxID=2728851 RepID=UPI003088173F|nr:hypothetical protein NSDW_32920 [Novosphingobium olei]